MYVYLFSCEPPDDLLVLWEQLNQLLSTTEHKIFKIESRRYSAPSQCIPFTLVVLPGQIRLHSEPMTSRDDELNTRFCANGSRGELTAIRINHVHQEIKVSVVVVPHFITFDSVPAGEILVSQQIQNPGTAAASLVAVVDRIGMRDQVMRAVRFSVESALWMRLHGVLIDDGLHSVWCCRR